MRALTMPKYQLDQLTLFENIYWCCWYLLILNNVYLTNLRLAQLLLKTKGKKKKRTLKETMPFKSISNV